jgi:hypothetical protein
MMDANAADLRKKVKDLSHQLDSLKNHFYQRVDGIDNRLQMIENDPILAT